MIWLKYSDIPAADVVQQVPEAGYYIIFLHLYCNLTWPSGNLKTKTKKKKPQHLDDKLPWVTCKLLLSNERQKLCWMEYKHGVANTKGKKLWGLHLCMVKHTHDEFEYIQSINYESPVLLAMHQLGRGKRSNTVPWVHGSMEEKLMQHTGNASVTCFVCVGSRRLWRQSYLRLIINLCVCICICVFWGVGGWGGSLHFPLWRCQKKKKKSSISCRVHCTLIDYAEFSQQ